MAHPPRTAPAASWAQYTPSPLGLSRRGRALVRLTAEAKRQGASPGEQDAQDGEHRAVADRVGQVAEARGPPGLAHQDEGHEHADDTSAALGRGHIHHERGERRVEEAMRGAAQDARQHEEGSGRKACASHDRVQAGEQHGGAGLKHHRRNDHGPAAGGVREAAGGRPQDEGRHRVGDREGADPSDPQVDRVGREEREHHALPEPEGRAEGHRQAGRRNNPAQEARQPLARHKARRRREAEPRRDDAGQEGEGRRGQKESAEAGSLHQQLAERGTHRAGDEARDPEDPEGLAAPVRRSQVHDDREVRDEEDREGGPLEGAQHRKPPERIRDGREGERHRRGENRPPHEEGPAPATVDPRADEGLNDDRGGAEARHDQPQLTVGRAEAAEVERQQDEGPEPGEEEEIRDRRRQECGGEDRGG